MWMSNNIFLTNFLRLALLPIAVLAATAGRLHGWERKGYLKTKELRYQAYLFLFWVNLSIWGWSIPEVTLGYELPTLRAMLYLSLMLIMLLLGITSYIPRPPPVVLRKKIFTLTTFALTMIFFWIPLPISPSTHAKIFLSCHFLFIESITGAAEAMIGLTRNL